MRYKKKIIYYIFVVTLLIGCGFSSNGERIYVTATSRNGEIKVKEGTPMMGNSAKGCAHCHGTNGKGGHSLDASGLKAPDIRYQILEIKYGGYLSFLEGEGKKVDGGIDSLIKKAITDGDGPGYKLNVSMPRWEMSENDLNDVINYLKMLP